MGKRTLEEMASKKDNTMHGNDAKTSSNNDNNDDPMVSILSEFISQYFVLDTTYEIKIRSSCIFYNFDSKQQQQKYIYFFICDPDLGRTNHNFEQ